MLCFTYFIKLRKKKFKYNYNAWEEKVVEAG